MADPFSLAGRRVLVTGVANKRSIAWGIATALRAGGATIGLSYQAERLAAQVRALGASIDAAFVEPCDVTDPAAVDRLLGVARELGGLDGLVHAVAFADARELEGDYLRTTREGFLLAHEASAWSLTALVRAAAPLLGPGSAVLTITYLGSRRVVPGYNVMGVAKASLEASVRYLANDLGPRGVRVNAISAGPVKTLAASAVAGLSRMMQNVTERAPLRRNVTTEQIGHAARFLLSDAAAGVTGEILHVDSGHHVLSG